MKKIYLSGLLFFLVLQGMTQVLLSNSIDDANPSAYNPFTLGQTVAGNITASGIGRGSGISGNAGSNRYNAANWSTGSMDMNDYFEFTFTPAAGYEIDFTSFVYTAQKSGTGPSSYAFRSSVDGFVSNIGSPGQTSGNISLTAAAYQNISGPITFRYYAWGASGSTGTYSINDFSFNGNVSLAVSNAISTTGTYSSYCNGVSSSVSVSFSPTGSFTGNFTAQLSDASGSFASPTVIGTGSSSPISATIPSGMAAGNAYRIRVIHSGSNTIGTDNGSNISLLTSPVVNLGNDTAYCMGTVFNLSLDAQNTGSSYEWSNFSTSQTLHVAQAGTFSVTVTAPNTCETTDAITVSELALPQVDLGVDLAYCIGTSFSQTLDAGNSGASYNWNNGAATTQTYVATAAGTYSVWVTDANGCQNMDELIVVENGLPIVDLGNDTAYCVGSPFSKTLDAGNVGATYNWNDGAASSQTFTATTAGMYKVVVTDANGCENRDSITVTENALPLVDIGPTTLAYCAGTNFSQMLDAGNPGATFQWTSGIVPVATSQTYTVTSAGLYGVLVTDANGCQNVDGVMVTENSLPTVDLGNDLSYCVGTTFSQVLDAGNLGLTYNWNNGAATTQTYTATTAGIYSVTVTDGNGCENSDQLTVTENALPVVDLGTDLAYCSGTNFSQTLDAGNTGASYNWNNGTANTQTFVATTAGNYTVEVMDANGCVSSDILTVTENALPVVDLGADLAYCSGTNFSQTLDAGNTGATYNWNNGTANTQTFVATTAGNYTVEVTDANGCVGTDNLTVTENALPVVDLGTDMAYCSGANFSQTLDAGNTGATYNWNNGTANTQTFVATSAGNYTVEVTDANGCVGADVLLVVENLLPVVALGNDTSYCSGASFSLLLNAENPGASYSWNGGAFNSQIFAVSQAGIYGVVVTDANGCSNSDEVIVTENPLPGINLGNDTSYCTGSNFSLVLNAQNAGSTYVWNNGSITPTVTATQAGTYWVVVTNASGCVNTDSLVVTENALPLVDLGADVSTLNTSYVLDAGVGYSSYSWAPGGQTSQQLLVTQSGTYTVTVSNANGCTASDEIVVSLGSVSVNENQVFDMTLTVYPNPSANYLFVKVPDYEGEAVLSILSVNGKRVFFQSYAGLSTNQTLSVDVSGFQSGNYILQLLSEKFAINRRIIVSK